MSKIIEIRKRLESVQKIGRVTNAMQLVSASRFHQSYQRMSASRPYVKQLQALLANIDQGFFEATDHPFFKKQSSQTKTQTSAHGVILLGTQKGLCGSLNHRLLKTVLSSASAAEKQPLFYWTMGEKIKSLMQTIGMDTVSHSEVSIGEDGFFDLLFEVIEQYKTGAIQQVSLVYTRYVSAMVQEPVKLDLLPIDPQVLMAMRETSHASGSQPKDYLVEPSVPELLDFLLTQYLRSVFYQAALESDASEQASRMVAMKTATDNARRLEDKTQLHYNNVRQSLITAEIIEIVSGSEAV